MLYPLSYEAKLGTIMHFYDVIIDITEFRP